MSTGVADLRAARARTERARMYRMQGAVIRVVGLAVESEGPPAAIGEECLLLNAEGKLLSRTQVVGFSGHRVFSMPVERLRGIAVGARVVAVGRQPTVGVGDHLLGRVLDADGLPLDGGSLGEPDEHRELEGKSPHVMRRERIHDAFVTGIRSVDSLLTLGRGQRIGIFAGSGVGKSTLLGMMARHSRADVAVIALVGERGREVRDFIEDELGPSGLARAVVFVATSDEPPLRRIRAAQAATTTAEYFRDRGQQVMLLMDSITRVAMAQREIGLSLGEPPSTKGYPPSVFSLLPRLLERAGAVQDGGSITGLYNVYVESDDLNEPVSDAARSLLDGHVVLSRELADRGHYPAVDVLTSVSRLMPQVAQDGHLGNARVLRARMSALKEAEDLVMLGAYRDGADPEVDAALRARSAVAALLRQPREQGSDFAETLGLLQAAVESGEGGSE